MHWGLTGSVCLQGPAGYGGIRGHWGLVGGVGTIRWPVGYRMSGVHGRLAGTVGAQGSAGV